MPGPMMDGWERFRRAAEIGAAAGLQAAGAVLQDETIEILGPAPRRTGRIYKRRSVHHQASAPGEAPAPDQGILRGSIKVVPLEPLKVRVGSFLAYAPALEYGTLLTGQREVRLMKLNTEISKARGFRRLDLVKNRLGKRRTLAAMGVRSIKARPFLRPARERAQPKMNTAFVEEARVVTLRQMGF